MRLVHVVERCGARSKRTGQPCKGPAIDGVKRARQAALRHGFYTDEAKAERRGARAALTVFGRL